LQSEAELIKAIREAGRVPVQRDTFYRPLKAQNRDEKVAATAT